MTSPPGPPDELRVTPGHLRELAQKHGDAATRIGQATGLVDGVSESVLRTHGQVCSVTAAAAELVAEARRRACIALETMSQAHEANLNTAASQYVRTDAQGGRSIDEQMPPR